MKPIKQLVDQIGLYNNERRWQVGSKNRYEANDFSHTTLIFRQVEARYLFINAVFIARVFSNFVFFFPNTGDDVDHNA